MTDGEPTQPSPKVGRSSRPADRRPPVPRPPERRPPSRRGRGWLFAALFVAAAVIGILVWAGAQLRAPSTTPDVREFEVMPGWGASRVAAELEAEGLIRDDEIFSWWLRARGLDRELGEGVYDLSPHLGAREIGRRLARGGRPRTVEFVVPEGFRLADVAQRLAAAGLSDASKALATMREPGELLPEFVPAGSGLEGYLFPARYEVVADATTQDVLARMIDRFRDEIEPTDVDRLVDMGLHVHEWVTLASMVQAEAADATEMGVIAGVFLNRLDLGMPLQSDPTAAYGLGKDLPDLTAGDLRQDHPWNTYTRGGLPIGPIGNPGSAALDAVLSPVRTDDEGTAWLYFLHGTDEGEPVFRPNTSLDAHERDIDRYLR